MFDKKEYVKSHVLVVMRRERLAHGLSSHWRLLWHRYYRLVEVQ